MGRRILDLFLLLSLSSCLTPLELEDNPSPELLVVTGGLSQLDSVYQVTLSTSTDRSGFRNSINPLGFDAQVTLENQRGETATFTETSRGVYKLDATEMPLERNLSYRLNMTLRNGERYQSTWVERPEPIEILRAEANLIRFPNQFDRLVTGHIIEFTVQNSEEKQFFIVNDDSYAFVPVGYGDCDGSIPAPFLRQCWHKRNAIGLIVADNQSIATSQYSITAAFVRADYKGEFVTSIFMDAMSQSSHDYWKDILQQLNRPGGTFDAPFAPIEGNVSSVDTGENALGYFQIWTRTSETLCIDRTNLFFQPDFVPTIGCNQRCIDFWSPGTYEDVSAQRCLQ